MGKFKFLVEGLVGVAITLGLLFLTQSWFQVGGSAVRPPQPCTGHEATIASVGDMMLADRAQSRLDKHGFTYPFKKVKPLLEADYLMGNLEAPITVYSEPFLPDKKYTYKQDLAAGQALKDTGFDLLVLANNHTLDYGPTGLADTLELADQLGLTVIGGGPDEESARAGTVVEINGTRVGILAYMEPYGSYERQEWFADGDHPGCSKMTKEAVREDIARMREQADLVIVHAHYGRNYKPPTRKQEKYSRMIIDAGADVVNGHHSHAAQGIEIYKGKPIIYSLGNFTFGTGGRFGKGKKGYGLVARYNLCEGRIASIEFDLIGTNNRIVKYQPTIIGAEEAKRVMGELNEAYGTVLRWEGSTAILDLAAR